MSLLDNASLLLTPNAYKEGKLYSVIPSNGNGDFTVTRATTATRVNSAGLVDLVPYNLLQYSEMFSNAAWTKTASSVTANSTTSPSGVVDADTFAGDGTSAQHQISQSTTITSGLTYTASIYAKKNTNNFIQIYNIISFFGSNVWANFDLNNGVIGSVGSAATASITSVGNGWYRCTITGTAIASGAANASFFHLVTSATAARGETNSLSTSVFLWGAQLVEGTSARDYLRTETRLNIPRVDYSLGGCPNILLEPQRTNLALQSSSFDSATWAKFQTNITANSTTSPSGVVDADTLFGNGTAAGHQIVQTSASTLISGTAYTTSIYAKKNTNNFIQILGSGTPYPLGTIFANFDLNNGVVGSVGAGTTASITSVGNGWYRCQITATAGATTSVNSFVLALVTSATSPRGEINSLSTSVFLWGAQLEAGAYATSYIPTTTASVTRNADQLIASGVSSLIGQTQGTIYCEARIGASDTSGVVRMLGGISDGTLGNRIELYRFNNAIQYDNIVGGAIQFAGSVSTITNFNTTLKIAIRYSLNNVKTFINGVLVNTDTSALIPTCSRVSVGCDRAGSASYGGLINEMALFPTPLTDAQCIALTQ